MPRSPSLTPRTACVLSTAAGLIVLSGAFLLSTNRVTAGLAWLAAASGAVMVVAGSSLLVAPKRHQALGALIIVASAIAFYTYGWVPPSAVGVALGLAGGIVAVQWEPPARIQPAPVR